MLTLDLALMCEQGGRKYNEDACGHWQGDGRLCCVVADGAGGHGGGDIASRLVVSELLGAFAAQPSAQGTELSALVRRTNQRLIAERVPGTPRQDMHSTVVCLVLELAAQRAHWAHAGDSRLYWVREGRLLTRTRDHSLVQQLVDSNVIAAAQMRRHPRRSELRSALGLADEALEVDHGEGPAAGAGAVQAGDAFLLCTDGVWEHLEENAIVATLAAPGGPPQWLAALEAQVREAAAQRVTHDNFSAVAVGVRAGG
jgi:PPM family protein phosphatase